MKTLTSRYGHPWSHMWMMIAIVAVTVGVGQAAENIAPLAKVSATVNNENARRAVDGKVPAAGSRDDSDQTWVIKKTALPASLTFSWDERQPVSTIVYYGRTTWGFECFDNYEIYIDDAGEPVAKGTLKQGHGPQLITLPQGTRITKLTLKFLTAKGNSPGASEIQIFDTAPADDDLLCRFSDFSFDFRYAYYPSHNLIRVLAPEPPADAKTWHITVRPKDGNKIFAESRGNLPMDVAAESISVPDLPAGNYTLTLTLEGGAQLLIEERGFQRHHYEWEGLNLGLDDVLIPPFTPLVADSAKQTVDCVLRTHTHGEAGLWNQVVSRNSELLASPVRLEATIGGKAFIASGSPAKFATATSTQVIGQSAWSIGPVKGSTVFAYDYDGFMQVTLKLDETDTEIDRLQLVIPMKTSEAWLLHPVTVQLRQHFAGRLPSGKGKVWDSSSVKSLVGGHFVPYLYLGGPERGICFAADNDRDWIRGDGVPMMEIDREGDTVNLRLNLIAKPSVLSRERVIKFALQSTPAKPMPETPYNWRRWWTTRTSKDSEDVQIAFWGGNGYWGGRYFATSVFPDGKDFSFWDKLAEQRHTGQLDKEYLARWLANYDKLPETQRNKITPAMKAGFQWSSFTPANGPDTKKFHYVIPYTNPRGCTAVENRDFVTTYLDEWQTIDITHPGWTKMNPFNRIKRINGFATWYHVEPVPTRVDMLLYYHQKMFETFADGIYWDNMFLRASSVPAEAGGPAYVDDDGKLQPGVNLMDFRSLVRRTAVMMHVMGKRPLAYIHMTNVNMVPMLSFATLNLDWEWRDQGAMAKKDLQDRLGVDGDPALILTQSLGLKSGNITVAIDRFHPPKNSGTTREWLFRTAMAVCFPHEIKVYQGTKDVSFIQDRLDEFGYGLPDCKVFRYWEPDFPLETEGANMHALVLTSGGKAMIALGNYGPAKSKPEAMDDGATDDPSLEDYDAAQRGLKKPGKTATSTTGKSTRAMTYKVRLKLDMKALGLPDTANAYDVELRAGRTKADNIAAVILPAKPSVEALNGDADTLHFELDESKPGLLKRLAPGVFELTISNHDFALIEIE
jgi:hypothetical protein